MRQHMLLTIGLLAMGAVALLAGLWVAAHFAEDLSLVSPVEEPTVEWLNMYRAGLEAYAKDVVAGRVPEREDGFVGYQVPPSLCEPQPVIITKDGHDNVFFEVSSNTFQSAGLFHCGREEMPTKPPSETEFAEIRQLDGPWYVYRSH